MATLALKARLIGLVMNPLELQAMRCGVFPQPAEALVLQCLDQVELIVRPAPVIVVNCDPHRVAALFGKDNAVCGKAGQVATLDPLCIEPAILIFVASRIIEVLIAQLPGIEPIGGATKAGIAGTVMVGLANDPFPQVGLDHVIVISVLAAELAMPVFGPQAVERWIGVRRNFTGADRAKRSPAVYIP